MNTKEQDTAALTLASALADDTHYRTDRDQTHKLLTSYCKRLAPGRYKQLRSLAYQHYLKETMA